jgi:hypothetical protein
LGPLGLSFPLSLSGANLAKKFSLFQDFSNQLKACSTLKALKIYDTAHNKVLCQTPAKASPSLCEVYNSSKSQSYGTDVRV